MKSSEDRLETRYVRSLRKEIIKLKRENAQLRKKNSRLENELPVDEYDNDEDTYQSSKGFNKHQPITECESCGSYKVRFFSAGLFDFYTCDSCGAKGKSEKAV